MRRSLFAAAVAVALLIAVPATASAKVKWLCAPGVKKNPCTPSMRTTVFSTYDAQLRVEARRSARKPKIDCFYVYPTVSNQSTDVATKRADPEIKSIALYQAARFSQVCRVFAPVYRQVTIQGLNRGKFNGASGEKDIAEAFKQFLSRYSRGRGFVLIGHSQGAGRLETLIQKQIDNNAKLRTRMLSAVILGGTVTVKKDSDAGGTFKNVPACRRTEQLGCVIAFSTYNAPPPEGAPFTRARNPDEEVLCTNPAALQGGPIDLDSIISTTPFAAGYLAAGIQLTHFPLPRVSTPFIEGKAWFSGECAKENGNAYLLATSNQGTPVPDAVPPAWGLHLLDVNIAQGDLLRLVRTQTRAYLR